MVITKKIMNRIISLGCSYAIDVDIISGQQSHFPGSSIELLLENVKNLTNLKRFKDYKFIMDITQVGRLSKKTPNEIVKELSEYGKLFLDNVISIPSPTILYIFLDILLFYFLYPYL